jgi:LacI family transcriptional regulator
MISPCLTTYRQDTARIAQEVFNLMIDSIEFPESHVPKLVTVSGKLVEGETVG